MAVSFSNLLIIIISIISPILYSGQVSLLIQKLNELCHWKHGCNPTPSLGNVTLHCYSGRRGRAEPVRLLMEDQQVPYREVTYDEETWSKYVRKQSNAMLQLFTFEQLPAISTTRYKRLAQKVPILHMIGRSVGVDCDCSDISRCEMIAAGVGEFHHILQKLINDHNFNAQTRNQYLRDIAHRWLVYFEKLLTSDSLNWFFSTDRLEDGPYFASGRITWVDYLVYDVVETHCDFLEYTKAISQEGLTLDSEPALDVPENCFQLLEKVPHLGMFMSNIKGRTNIRAYMASGRRNVYIPLS